MNPERASQISLLRNAMMTAAVMAAFWLCGCHSGGSGSEEESSHAIPDTLRVATLYSPGSYFIYRDQPMGYDYSLVSQFAKDKGVELQIEVAPSLHRAIEMLDSGRIDLIAYEIPEIAEYRESVVACGPRNETHQVLVQPKVDGKAGITDVTQLPGHQVYVEGNTKYLYRLQNLNDELGGGIGINIVDNDTLMAEDLIDMVADAKIPLTVVDSDVAMVNATYYPTLDVSLALSFPQTSSWGVAPGRKWLGDSIDAWLDTDVSRKTNADLHKRYFEASKVGFIPGMLSLRGGRISSFDEIFRRYAPQIGWDWRLLASQGYQESNFNPDAVSWAGARGLMQITPGTARNYGINVDNLSDPEASVAASVKIIADLDRSLRKRVPDDGERMKFVLAAYNGGIGHITDAIALAEKLGLDPSRWDDNVAKALLLKASPEYYNDPVVRCGYFRGRETISYVTNVLKFYDTFRRQIPA